MTSRLILFSLVLPFALAVEHLAVEIIHQQDSDTAYIQVDSLREQGRSWASHSEATSALTVALEAAVVEPKINRPIIITAKLTNASSEAAHITIHRPNPQFALFHFELNCNGKDLSKTTVGRDLSGEYIAGDSVYSAEGSFLPRTLKPHESIDFPVEITKLFKIEEPGSCVLSAEVRGRDKSVPHGTMTHISMQIAR